MSEFTDRLARLTDLLEEAKLIANAMHRQSENDDVLCEVRDAVDSLRRTVGDAEERCWMLDNEIIYIRAREEQYA